MNNSQQHRAQRDHLEDIKEIIFFPKSSSSHKSRAFGFNLFSSVAPKPKNTTATNNKTSRAVFVPSTTIFSSLFFSLFLSLFCFLPMQIIFVAFFVNYATCRTAKDYRERPGVPAAAVRQSQVQPFPSYNLDAPDGNANTELKDEKNFIKLLFKR